MSETKEIETKSIETKEPKKIKMIKDHFYVIRDVLEEIKATNLDDVKFNYVMGKNLKLFKMECQELDELTKLSEKYTEFDNKRMGLIRDKYAERDENNNIVMYGEDPKRHQVKIKVDLLKEFEIELNKLKNEYKDELDKRDKTLVDFNNMLFEEVPENFFDQVFKFTVTLDESGLPTNLPKGLLQKHIDALMDLILIEKK